VTGRLGQSDARAGVPANIANRPRATAARRAGRNRPAHPQKFLPES